MLSGLEIVMEKRNIVFVETPFQLIEAIQIRTQMRQDEKFDIVLSDSTPSLGMIHAEKRLEGIFDNIYFWENISFYGKSYYSELIKPGSFAKSIFQTKLDYSDCFFWNPTPFFWSFLNLTKEKVKLHIIGDSQASYITDSPDSPTNIQCCYRSRIYKLIYERKKVYTSVYKKKYDYYIFSPEYIVFKPKHNIIEIPSDFDFELYNGVFNYGIISEIKEEYIFLDQVHGEDGCDAQCIYQTIKKFAEHVGKGNLAIKPHPRQNADFYDGIEARIITQQYPWEAYCMKYDISKKKICGFQSSSMSMPKALFKKDYNVIFFETKRVVEFPFDAELKMFVDILFPNRQIVGLEGGEIK